MAFPTHNDPVDVVALGAAITEAINAKADELTSRTRSGSTPVTVTSSATGSAVVEFNPPMAGTPKITFAPGNHLFNPAWASKTPAGFTLNVRHTQGTATSATVTVDWIAEL